MKGLNCYASFCDDPGIEKLLALLKVKSSFLMPVTPLPCQLAPFIRSHVAGVSSREFISVSSDTPATPFFAISHFGQGGTARASLSCLAHFAIIRAATQTGLPFFSSTPYIFPISVRPSCYPPRGLNAFGPTVFWRYHDIL